MAWWIGVDEAGYGPNLGPLVMTAVACRSADDEPVDFWKVLAKATRNHAGADERLFVADSKRVFAKAKRLAELEKTVLALGDGFCATTNLLLQSLCVDGHLKLGEEIWFTGKTPLPTAVKADVLDRVRNHFRETSATQHIEWGPIWCMVVCPKEFNALLDRYSSKGAVLGLCLTTLLKTSRAATNGDSVSVFIDKHGGRNQYAPILQAAFEDGFVIGQEENADRSIYDVTGLDGRVRITIEPRADGNHFCVALASLVSKYVRELLMMEFNHFWRTHLPKLKATAGYPVDAVRFFQEIRPVMEELGIKEETVWRRR